MIYDITLTDLQCSFSGRDVSLFGPRTPICPDEKEFWSFGQKTFKGQSLPKDFFSIATLLPTLQLPRKPNL